MRIYGLVCSYQHKWKIAIDFPRRTQNMSLNIPSGTSTVEVFMISPSQILDVAASAFLTPKIPGITYEDTPCLFFLIEHVNTDGRRSRAPFDLCIRSD